MNDVPGEPAIGALVGAGMAVPCLDGVERPYRDLDCAASTPALVSVAKRVADFLPTYSSVHRGAGYKSRASTAAYEHAREAVLRFAGREGSDDVAIICRNTTEAINHLAYRLQLAPDDVVALTVVEHHANLLPWARVATRRWIECEPDGTVTLASIEAALDAQPRPKILAISGASNVTGWLPPVDQICDLAHNRGVEVVLDAAQLAPHRPLPNRPDYVAFSGHKLYAPYGAGALIGPIETFREGDPFLAGGGAVDLVDVDEVIWAEPPEREEAGSPNVVGAVALGAAIEDLAAIGWDPIIEHERALAQQLRRGLSTIEGVQLLGPALDEDTLAVGTFTVRGLHHGLVAARLSAEWGIGVRHGCFCAHPYLLRLLGLGKADVDTARAEVLRGDRRNIPGAVRASCGLGTSSADVDLLLEAVEELAGGLEPPVPYFQDEFTGDFWPHSELSGWSSSERPTGAACAARLTGPLHERLGRARGNRHLIAVLLVLIAGSALQACGSSASDEAWVANYSFTSQPGTSIAAINLDAPAADGIVTTASLPTGLAATPDGSEVVVANRANNSISVVQTSSHDVSATWSVGLEPDALAITSQGGAELGVVANFGANSLSIIDIADGKLRATVPVGVQPDAVAIAPGGTNGAGTALVANFSSDSLSEIDLGTDTVTATIHTAPEPDAVAVDPAPTGPLALVTSFLDDTVTTINLATGAATPSALPLNPTDAVWDPSRSVSWISGGSGLVSFSPSSGVVGIAITVPSVAEAVALGAGGKIAWVALQNGSVVPVTLDTESVGPQIKIGGRPSAIVITH